MNEHRTIENVRDVLARHRDTILATYRAVGTGIGRSDDGTAGSYLIVVYLASRRDMPEGGVTIDEVPLQFVVTGELSALR